MVLAILALGLASFVISWLLTALMIRVAPRIGFVDKPGQHKTHVIVKPLGGGVAIFLAFALPLIAGLIGVQLNLLSGDSELQQAYIRGAKQQAPLAWTLLACVLVMHIMGLIDDRKPLGPYVKLVIQLAAAALLVICF